MVGNKYNDKHFNDNNESNDTVITTHIVPYRA